MQKILIILISVVILKSMDSYAGDNASLPELPTSTNTINTHPPTEEKNLWEKIKTFFGFINKEKEIIAEKTLPIKSIKPPSNFDPNFITPKNNEPEDEKTATIGKDSKAIEQLKLPAGFEEEVAKEDSNLAGKNPDNASKDDEAIEQLKLPAGFEEEPAKVDNNLADKKPDDAIETNPNLPVNAVDKVSQISGSSTPQEVNSNNPITNKKDNLEKYTKEIETRKNTSQNIPKLVKESSSQANSSDKNQTVNKEVKMEPAQLEFISNEAQVLIQPNDDVVLGNLTEEAKIKQMDFRSYLVLFQNNYNRLSREPERDVIIRYIENYNEIFNE
jgi:hypothetical protein